MGRCDLMEQNFHNEIDSLSGIRLPVNIFIEKITTLQTRILEEMKTNKKLQSSWRKASARQLKWFKEELVVIRSFLSKRGGENEFITVVKGSQNFDGKWERCDGEINLEVTVAKDGHLERRLMEHLEKYKRAPSTLEDPDPIKKDKDLLQEYRSEATCVLTAIQKEYKMITERVAAKVSSPLYKGRYVLLIGYSPNIPARFEEVVENFSPLAPNSVFERVFLVESWGGNLFEVPFFS